ncbi:hypothetical protein Q5425_36570 [Amycolatopsis sp. A133]|uniref:hypothetical protein n=1 Tax=Amycolatopsis sp. A133 TaxID=3064472 RepID=UPI0027FFF6E0|nr:hypothetical protein [Amycolatopsis sp. A133]MDQ7809271.1 hypothetical protein [Amycolatopsis sp. A133]
MASPDTDELATVPLPAAPPAAEPEHIQPEPSEPERIQPEPSAPESSTPAASAAPEPSAPARPRGRWWRGITGSLAAGLAVLAVGILVVAGICLYTGAPGPGATLLIGHPVAAVLALLAQRAADRRDGPAAVGAGVAVALFTVSALTLFWLT